ncbi:hypothetical protein WA158_003551 [Blastocystis sp. Blastoise]
MQNNNTNPNRQSQYWTLTLFGEDLLHFNEVIQPSWNSNGLPFEINYVALSREVSPTTNNTHVHLYMEMKKRLRRNQIIRLLSLEHTDVRPREWSREATLIYLSEINEIDEYYNTSNTLGYGANFQNGMHRDLINASTYNGVLYNMNNNNSFARIDPISTAPMNFTHNKVKYSKNKKHPKKISEEVASMIKNGCTYEDIWEEYASFALLHSNNIKKAIYDFNTKKRNTAPIVLYLYGKTGVGKTYTAKKICELGENEDGKGSYYMKNGDIKWWDGYKGQFGIIIDDFRKIYNDKDLLRILDYYDVGVETKGSTVKITSPLIIFTSDRSLKENFKELSNDELEQLLRRFYNEYELLEDNTIDFKYSKAKDDYIKGIRRNLLYKDDETKYIQAADIMMKINNQYKPTVNIPIQIELDNELTLSSPPTTPRISLPTIEITTPKKTNFCHKRPNTPIPILDLSSSDNEYSNELIDLTFTDNEEDDEEYSDHNKPISLSWDSSEDDYCILPDSQNIKQEF